MKGENEMKKMKLFSGISLFAIAALLVALVSGCATKAQTGALAGSGVGALAGQLIGGDTTSTLIGTAVGTGIGYIIGNEMDKKKAKEMNQRSKSTNYNHNEVGPLGGTKWKVLDVAPKDRLPKKFTTKTLEFGPNGHLTTRTTYPDGTSDVAKENYRVVDDTIIVNKPGYLVNAKYSIQGDDMTMDVKGFRAILKRMR